MSTKPTAVAIVRSVPDRPGFQLPLLLPEKSETSLLDDQIEEMIKTREINEYLAKCSRVILSDSESDRLQYLNQEIADLREELNVIEDWDAYAQVTLKYHIILYEEERNRVAQEAHRRALKDLLAREMRGDSLNLIYEELSWDHGQIEYLRKELKTATVEERPLLVSQLNRYSAHARNLLHQSARVVTDTAVSWMAEPHLASEPEERVDDSELHARSRSDHEESVREEPIQRDTNQSKPQRRRSRKCEGKKRAPHRVRNGRNSNRPAALTLKILTLFAALAALE